MTPSLSRVVLLQLPGAVSRRSLASRSSPVAALWRVGGSRGAVRRLWTNSGDGKGSRGFCTGGAATQRVEEDDQQVQLSSVNTVQASRVLV